MYHYGYVSGGNYALAGAVVLAVALTALLVILVLPKERDGRLPRFFQILHDLFQPKTFVIERIVQILYVFFTCLSVLVGLYDFLGALFGLQMGLLFRALFFLLIAPALLRGAYELILLLVMVYGSIVVVLTGNWFFNWFRTQFSMLPLPKNLRWIRLMILFGIALLVLALLYRVTAPWSHQRPPVLKGAFFISILLAAASGLFSVFISLSTRYSTVYGSLASVIILMLWLYLCGNIVNLGNVLNYVWWRRKQGLPVRFLLEKQL